jgi:hypothetical protein
MVPVGSTASSRHVAASRRTHVAYTNTRGMTYQLIVTQAASTTKELPGGPQVLTRVYTNTKRGRSTVCCMLLLLQGEEAACYSA